MDSLRRLVVPLLFLLVVRAPALAQAAEPGPHPPNVVGFKAGPMVVLEPTEDRLATGTVGFVGVFYEREVLPQWIDLEITVPVALGRRGNEAEVFFPLDLHVKKPFHPGPRFAPYVGLGPALDVFVAPELKVMAGGSLALGTYLWPRHAHVGFDVDLDYNVLEVDGRAAHEFLLAFGPIWHW